MELLIIIAIVGITVALVSELIRKDKQVIEYQNALVNAYTEIEMMKAGLLK